MASPDNCAAILELLRSRPGALSVDQIAVELGFEGVEVKRCLYYSLHPYDLVGCVDHRQRWFARETASVPLAIVAKCPHTEGLTDTQAEVVALPPERSAVVLAGAGTGKTEVLTRRAAHLVDCSDVAAGSEVLILTFTRSVAAELKRRLRVEGGRSAYIDARTFDSFATRLLSDTQEDDVWRGLGYDERIEAATHAVETGECRDLLESWRHILVDEIQDLVGPRAEFVRAMLDHCLGGATLFGDWAQAIYGWQENGRGHAGAGRAFRRFIEDRFGERETFRFEENFRVKTAEAGLAVALGQSLNSARPDYQQIRVELDDILSELTPIPLPVLSAAEISYQGRSAVLARSNGQALLISQELWRYGVAHALRPRSQEPTYASWIAELLSQIPLRVVSQEGFCREAGRVGLLAKGWDPLDAWRSFIKVARGQGGALDLSRAANAVALGILPDDLKDHPDDRLQVSTIHRAKGLEYDRVYLLDDLWDGSSSDEEFEEETRVRYVMLTRCREEMPRLTSLDSHSLRHDRVNDRWWTGGHKTWMTLGFEVRPEDIDAEYPAGSRYVSADPEAIQQYLASEVRSGDAVVLRKASESAAPPMAIWVAYHLDGSEERPIGVTTSRFSNTYFRSVHKRCSKVTWPDAFEGLHVHAIDTVAGSPAAGDNAGLGAWGLWMRPRIVGMGRCRYPKPKS